MLRQDEPGVLSGSEYFLNTVSETAQRLYYYIPTCGHYHCDLGYSIRRNFVTSLILLHIRQGQFNIEYKGISYHAKPGDSVLIDGTIPHFYYAPGIVEFYWMHIEGVNSFELGRHLIGANGIVFSSSCASQIAAGMYQIISSFRNNQRMTEAAYSLEIYNLFYYLMPETKENQRASERQSAVEQSKQYIRDNLKQELSLKDIASFVNLSPYYFTRVFKKTTGYSPHEYVIMMRIDKAKYLLKTTDLPIKEISYIIGYSSETGFINAFTQKVGVSPGRFRKIPLG